MAVCCQNPPLGALSSHSAPLVLVGALFKKFGLFFEHMCISVSIFFEHLVGCDKAQEVSLPAFHHGGPGSMPGQFK